VKVTVNSGPPSDLRLLDVNARFMTHETFAALVRNIRRDGALTQWPFVHLHDGVRTVLSGNHRVKAAIEAGLTEIHWIETDEELSDQQRIAIQLSHNAIAGQDDPAILASLYEQLDDIDWREYSGLDDATLGLMAEVTIDGLAEVNLEYQSLQFVFLPADYDAALAGFREAAELVKANERWLARIGDHVRLLDAVATASAAHQVRNQAAALAVVLDVFEAHRTDLADGYLDEAGEPRRGNREWVPLSTVFGTDSVPIPVAALLRRVVEKMTGDGNLGEGAWQALEYLAADWLAGP